jgi:integrase
MKSPRGSIRQHGRESWELSVRLNGRRMTRTIRAMDRSAAESALLDFRRELRDEGVPESDLLVRELAAEWLGVVSTRVKERTATRYRQLLGHALVVIGEMRVRAVKPGDCQRVLDRIDDLAEDEAPRLPRCLRDVGEAVGWGVLHTNPWTSVRAPRPERTQLRIPTAEETKTILEALRGSRMKARRCSRPGAALRLGEAIAVRWVDVNLEQGRIRVTATMFQDGRTEPKSAGSWRTVAMPIFVTQYLRAHKAAQAERRLRSVAWAEADYVFDRGGGEPMLLLSVSTGSAVRGRYRACRRLVPRSAPCLRHPATRAWGTSEGRQRSAWPRLDLDHHGHLQPRHAEHVAAGSRRYR